MYTKNTKIWSIYTKNVLHKYSRYFRSISDISGVRILTCIAIADHQKCMHTYTLGS